MFAFCARDIFFFAGAHFVHAALHVAPAPRRRRRRRLPREHVRVSRGVTRRRAAMFIIRQLHTVGSEAEWAEENGFMNFNAK